MQERDAKAWEQLRADLDATDMAAQARSLHVRLDALGTVVDVWATSEERRPRWRRFVVAMVLAAAWMAPSVLALWSAGVPLQSAIRWAILPTMGFMAMLLVAAFAVAVAHLMVLEWVTDAIKAARATVELLDSRARGRDG